MLRLSFGIKIRSLASRVIPVAAPRVMRLMTTKIQTNGSEQETPVGVVAFMQGRSRDLVANPPNKALQEMAERCKLSEDTVHKLWENFTYVDKGVSPAPAFRKLNFHSSPLPLLQTTHDTNIDFLDTMMNI